MKNKSLIKIAFLNSVSILIYTLIVALIIQNGQNLFGNMNNTVSIIAFLMLFVLSAVVVGSLIIAKPIMLYLDGAKKEALNLLILIIAILLIITLFSFIVLLAL